MGDADEAVPPEQSLDLAKAFATGSSDTPASGPTQTTAVCLSRWHQRKIWRHDGGHCVPQRAADVAAILNFLLEVQQHCIAPNNGGAPSSAGAVGGLPEQRRSFAPTGGAPSSAGSSGASGVPGGAAFSPPSSSAGAAGAATRITEAPITLTTLGPAISAPCIPAGLPPAVAAAPSPPSPPACAATGLQPPPPVQAQSSTAQTASDSVPGGFRAPEEQLEELEALEAIFGEEYERLSGTMPGGAAATPLAVRIRLREPGAGDDGAEEGEGGEGGGGPPSRRFSLVFTLPEVGEWAPLVRRCRSPPALL